MTRPYISFTDDNFYKCQGILTQTGTHKMASSSLDLNCVTSVFNHLKRLLRINCHEIQMYHFCRPTNTSETVYKKKGLSNYII